MTEEARKIVETIKEAFETLAAMELPAEEQRCEINRDNAMTLIAELEQVPGQEKVVKEFNYTLEVAERLQKDFESHAGSVDFLCAQVRHAVNIIKRLSAQLEQAENKLSELLSHATGGRFSKPDYSIDDMCRFVDDYNQSTCEKCDELAQVTRERDAAICDINMLCQCDVCTRMCKYDKPNPYCKCVDFEWRGAEAN